jgi:hypothetical protein
LSGFNGGFCGLGCCGGNFGSGGFCGFACCGGGLNCGGALGFSGCCMPCGYGFLGVSHASPMAFSPDGKWLAAASAVHYRKSRLQDPISKVEYTLALWDVASGKEVRSFPHQPDGIFSVTFAPDGKRVATHNTAGTILWDASSGRAFHRLRGGTPLFARDGRQLFTLEPGLLHAWDVDTGGEVRAVKFTNKEVFGLLALTGDGKTFLLSGTNQRFFLWQPDVDKEPRDSPISYHMAFAVAPDGRTLASLDNGGIIRLWSLATGRPIGVVDQVTAGGMQLGPQHLAFSPDSRLLAFGGMGGSIQVWEVSTRREICQIMKAPQVVGAVAIGPDDRTLAAAGPDNAVALHNLAEPMGTKRLAAVPLDAKRLEAAWTDLASRDARKAYRSVWLLALRPREAVPFLKDRLHPASADEVQRIVRLVADLDSDRFAERERASRELRRIGLAALPALRRALDGKPSLEMGRRIERLLQDIETEIPPPDVRRAARAVAILESAGGAEARQLLEALAGGPANDYLTEQARAALGRVALR